MKNSNLAILGLAGIAGYLYFKGKTKATEAPQFPLIPTIPNPFFIPFDWTKGIAEWLMGRGAQSFYEGLISPPPSTPTPTPSTSAILPFQNVAKTALGISSVNKVVQNYVSSTPALRERAVSYESAIRNLPAGNFLADTIKKVSPVKVQPLPSGQLGYKPSNYQAWSKAAAIVNPERLSSSQLALKARGQPY